MTQRRSLSLPDGTVDELGRMFHQNAGDECFAWLDTHTGDVLVATSLHGLDEVDEDEGDDNVVDLFARTLPDWQQRERAMVERVLADRTGRYLEVPVSTEFGRPGVLSDFVDTVEDPSLRDELYAAMRGRGAFRRVKDVLHARGEIQRWYDHEAERHRQSVREWLAEQGYALVIT